MSQICEFCNKEFSSIYSLSYHKKTAKFCVKIQNELTNNSSTDRTNWTCEFCKKDFILKLSWSKHISICKKKDNAQLEKYIEENKKLQEKNDLLKKEYEQQLFSIQNEYLKKEDDFKQKLMLEKNKLNDIEKENIALKTELKVRNEQIRDINEKHEQHTTQLRHEIQSLTEKLTARSITNNTNNTYIFNGIDFSQWAVGFPLTKI